jgi:starch phosphorylase
MKVNMKPVHSFIVSAHLPENLYKLKELAYNYWWCWNSGAKELFLRIDRELWEDISHNPVLLLNKLKKEQLDELSNQEDFISFLNYIYSKFERYMNSETWFDSFQESENRCIAYFSMEYGINESFPNYSGGLGVLSGDHVKSSSDLGIPLVAVGLLYQQGYFRQHLTQHGWQNELYHFNDFYSMPLTLMKYENGEPMLVEVDLPNDKAFAQIWKLNIGLVPLYLLDTNIPQNHNEEYRDITDQLYGGTRDTRIQQEILLGIGGMRALTLMGIKPEVIHINEGHAAFALLERTKMYMNEYNIDFYAAKQITRSSSIFTTHTPVPAGNEVFQTDRMQSYFYRYFPELQVNWETFMNFGQSGDYNPMDNFSMTILGLKFTSFHNGVSKLHGEVARSMWHHLWKCFPKDEVPLKSITNGIHTQTWVAREFSELFDRYMSPLWRTETDRPELWDKVDTIPAEEIWREKQRRRTRLVLFAREYLQGKQKAFLSPDQVGKANEYLDPDALTIGFARRFATYKRAMLLFSDMDRLKAILTDPEHPVQVIIAGKAHPHDTAGKEVIQSIIHKVRQYGLERHVVFLEDYDMVIARFMVKGCDIWLNTPVRPMEASGTSGMKAAVNGTLNLSILDGWWDEAYNGTNGFSIGGRDTYNDPNEQQIIESNELYEILEKVVVRKFYDRTKRNRVPLDWVELMKNSIKTIAGEFSTARMVKDYTNMYYVPALKNFKNLSADNGKKAIVLKEWKDKVKSEWNNISILDVSIVENGESYPGKPIKVTAEVALGGLTPTDVVVQVYYGTVDPYGELINTKSEDLEMVKTLDVSYVYEGSYICPDTGKQGFTVRILPIHKLMQDSAELYICAWAQ